MAGPVRILVEEPVESRPYINLTIDTMQRFGIDVMRSYPIEPMVEGNAGMCTETKSLEE